MIQQTRAFHSKCLTCSFEVNVKRKLCPNCGCNPKEDPKEREARAAAAKAGPESTDVFPETESAETVSHETPAPEPEKPQPEASKPIATLQSEMATRQAAQRSRMVYVADRDAIGYAGSVTMSVRAGQIITDEAVAQRMIEAGMAISRVSLDDMMVCPHCRKAIAIPEGRRARAS